MSHLIPREELLKKVAALRAADSMGKEMGQRYANEELAKVAGQLLAHMSPEDLAKLAGWGMFKALGGMAQRGMSSLGKVLRGGVRTEAVGGAMRRGVAPVVKPPPIKAPGKVTPAPGGAAGPYRAPAALTPAPASGSVSWMNKSPGQQAAASTGWGVAPKQSVPVTLGGQQVGTRQVAAKANAAAKEVASPGKVVPTQKQIAAGGAKATGADPAAAAAAAPKTPLNIPWGKAALLGGAGLAAYGAFKAVPWAARQLEQSSGQAMAPNLGWSATPYGYGYNPYGQQMTGQMNYGG